MDYRVKVQTLNGSEKTITVTNMPNMEAARAEAIAITFGRVLDVERIDDGPEEEPKPPKPKKLNPTEKELKPGETENVITSYNNSPLSVWTSLDITI